MLLTPCILNPKPISAGLPPGAVNAAQPAVHTQLFEYLARDCNLLRQTIDLHPALRPDPIPILAKFLPAAVRAA